MEAGASLTAISKELGIPKTTVKYWLDNAHRYLSRHPGKIPMSNLPAIKSRLEWLGWDILVMSYRALKSKLRDAPVRDLVYVISEIFDRQAQIGALTGEVKIPDRVIQVSEETRVTVREYLDKKNKKDREVDRAIETLEPGGEAAPTVLEVEVKAGRTDGNGANGAGTGST
jgi:hypothetical protein